jgi:hypothetical protein
MRKHDPNTSEVEVISGRFVGYGRDPVTSKLLVFFNINGVIYATDADAIDAPVTLTDVTDLLDFVPTSPGVGRLDLPTKLQFYSVKKLLTDILKTSPGVGQRTTSIKTPFESHNPAPELIAADPVTIRIPPPTAEPELSAIYGYYVARLHLQTNTISGGFHFIAWVEGESWVDWIDSGRPQNVVYIVIPVYIFDDRVDPVEGPPTDYIEVPPTFAGDILKTSPGVGQRLIATKVQFVAVKLEQTDILKTSPGVGRRFTANITGFDPKGI